MHLPTFLSTAALALTANAFLIPQEISDEVQAAKAKAIDFVPHVINHNTQSVKLDCASCPFALKSERNGQHEWTNDVESDLIMSFAAKDGHLTLNGKPFYPVTMQEMPGLLYAPQTKKQHQDTAFEGYEKDLKLSYTLEFQDEKTEDGNAVIGIIMTILGIDGEMIKIDNVKIEAIKGADGSLSLAKVTTVAPSPSDPDAQCTNMMCRLMTKLSAAISTARAKAAAAAHSTKHAAMKMKCFCMRCFHRMTGHRHHHARPKPAVIVDENGTTKLPTHNRVNPAQFRPHHGGHRHPSLLRKTMHFARHLFTFVLLPVLIGVAVGITASAVGMLVGQVVVFLWMKFRRNSSNNAYEAVSTDDKDGLPAYVDEGLPAYTDEENVIVPNEKAEEKA